MVTHNNTSKKKSNLTPYIITIIAVIISSIAGPIITYRYTKGVETQHMLEISQSRKNALEGEWKGFTKQVFEGKTISFPLTMVLKVDDKTISGNIVVNDTIFSKGGKWLFSCKGGFYSNRFLQLEYLNKDLEIVQFGVYILELLSNAKTLNGKFTGFGSVSEKIINGDIFFSKTN